MFTYWRVSDLPHNILQLVVIGYCFLNAFINFRFAPGNSIGEKIRHVMTPMFTFQLKMFLLMLSLYVFMLVFHLIPDV